MFKKILEKYELVLYFDIDIWFIGKIVGIFIDFCDLDILFMLYYFELFNY